jgi:uncharacterized protein YihD (DUF1040 family)
MKKNNRGFTLVETLVVSSFIVGILIFLFSQFSKLKTSYDASFEYNTVPALFLAKNINRYLTMSGSATIRNQVDQSTNGFIDITDCPSDYLNKTDYCRQLFSDLHVVSVLVTKESTFKSDLQDYLKDNNVIYHEKLYQFVKELSINNDNYNGYRIIAEFANDNFATVKLTY